ncbi:hypothetical protein MRBLMN1_002503 [Chitinophaga ginsengisegetis]|uniref:hypothetical protein n=1 Tax=Chitinophaga ginsengisegetis TaxID=393003 RepID=UPI0034267082
MKFVLISPLKKQPAPVFPAADRVGLFNIINPHYIQRYIRGEGGQIELENAVYVTVSQRKKEELLKKFRYKK